jgi:hypothetical protein
MGYALVIEFTHLLRLATTLILKFYISPSHAVHLSLLFHHELSGIGFQNHKFLDFCGQWLPSCVTDSYLT